MLTIHDMLSLHLALRLARPVTLEGAFKKLIWLSRILVRVKRAAFLIPEAAPELDYFHEVENSIRESGPNTSKIFFL